MGKDFKELLNKWRVPELPPRVDARLAETYSRSRRRSCLRCTGSIRLPAPLLAFLLVLQVISGAVIVRNFLSPAAHVTPAPERVVEVPVVKEKIVTHVVYLPAPSSDTLERRAHYSMAEKESEKPPMDLSGFKPVSEFRIQVIKGENRNER